MWIRDWRGKNAVYVNTKDDTGEAQEFYAVTPHSNINNLEFS